MGEIMQPINVAYGGEPSDETRSQDLERKAKPGGEACKMLTAVNRPESRVSIDGEMPGERVKLYERQPSDAPSAKPSHRRE